MQQLILNVRCTADEFITFIKKSIKFVQNDLCYPPYIRDELSRYSFSEDDAKHSFDLIKEVIDNFNGDAEVFYPQFYKVAGQKRFYEKSHR
jgi:hypothetical protein